MSADLVPASRRAELLEVDLEDVARRLWAGRLDDEALAAVVLHAELLQVDPRLGQITVVPPGRDDRGRAMWTPYVTHAGALALAHRTGGRLDGIRSRGVSVDDDQVLAEAEVYRAGCARPFVAEGRGDGRGTCCDGSTYVVGNALELATERVEHRALRLAFPADRAGLVPEAQTGPLRAVQVTTGAIAAPSRSRRSARRAEASLEDARAGVVDRALAAGLDEAALAEVTFDRYGRPLHELTITELRQLWRGLPDQGAA